MFCKNYQKIVVPFILILIIGISALNNLGQRNQSNKNQIKPCDLSGQGGGISGHITGIAADYDYSYTDKLVKAKPKKYPADTKPLQIISKPIAKYTDEARNNCIQGTVKLKITFFANGSLGNIKILKGLDYGLSNRAVEAAKLIKFEPEVKNNKPVTVIKKIRYNFTIY